MPESGAVQSGRHVVRPPKPETAPHKIRLPREHGFWVMLGAVVLSGLLKAEWSPGVVAVAGLFSVAVIAGAAWMDRQVRRSGTVQVVSSAWLGMLSLPLDVAGGRDISAAFATALVWAAIFAASALFVRAIFAGARSRGRRSAWRLTALSLVLPGVVALAGQPWTSGAELHAAAITTIFLGALALFRPGIKNLKPVGMALAVLHCMCAIILAVG